MGEVFFERAPSERTSPLGAATLAWINKAVLELAEKMPHRRLNGQGAVTVDGAQRGAA